MCASTLNTEHEESLIYSWNAVLRLKYSIAALQILPIGFAIGCNPRLALKNFISQSRCPRINQRLLEIAYFTQYPVYSMTQVGC
jgi:hypothetical protein